MIHEHHRKRRPHCTAEEYDAPWNKLQIGDELHEWIHANPEKAYEHGLLVHSWADPREIIVRIPESIRKATKAKPNKARPKTRVVIMVPQDELEDGAEVLNTLIDACREETFERMGWTEDVPPYYVLSYVLAAWLRGDK